MFTNMKIRMKLLLGFFSVALLAAIIGTVGIVNLNKLKNDDVDLFEKCTVPLGYCVDISTDFQRIRTHALTSIIYSDKAEIEKEFELIDKLDKDWTENLKKYEGTIIDETDRKNYQGIIALKAEYLKFIPQLKSLALENKDEEALALIKGDFAKVKEQLQTDIDVFSKYNVTGAAEFSAGNVKTAKSSFQIMLSIIIFSIVMKAVDSFGQIHLYTSLHLFYKLFYKTKNLIDI